MLFLFLLFLSHSFVRRIGLALLCWKMHKRCWKIWHVQDSMLSYEMSMYFFTLMLHKIWNDPCQGHRYKPVPSQILAFQLLADNSVNGPFLLLWSETQHPFVTKKDLEYWFVWEQYTFSLCDGPSQAPSNPETLPLHSKKVNIKLIFCLLKKLCDICGYSFVLQCLGQGFPR